MKCIMYNLAKNLAMVLKLKYVVHICFIDFMRKYDFDINTFQFSHRL